MGSQNYYFKQKIASSAHLLLQTGVPAIPLAVRYHVSCSDMLRSWAAALLWAPCLHFCSCILMLAFAVIFVPETVHINDPWSFKHVIITAYKKRNAGAQRKMVVSYNFENLNIGRPGRKHNWWTGEVNCTWVKEKLEVYSWYGQLLLKCLIYCTPTHTRQNINP